MKKQIMILITCTVLITVSCTKKNINSTSSNPTSTDSNNVSILVDGITILLYDPQIAVTNKISTSTATISLTYSGNSSNLPYYRFTFLVSGSSSDVGLFQPITSNPSTEFSFAENLSTGAYDYIGTNGTVNVSNYISGNSFATDRISGTFEVTLTAEGGLATYGTTKTISGSFFSNQGQHSNQ